MGGDNRDLFTIIKKIMSLIYYKFLSKQACMFEKNIPNGFKIDIVIPLSFTFHDIIWRFFSVGQYREYRLIEVATDKVVAKAQVMPKIYIFNFMDKGLNIHIGPCSTLKEYRGRGFYPLLLYKIINDYRSKVSCFYIFCDEYNNSSVRGIEKVGFQPFAKGVKNKWGIYVIKEYI